MEGQGEQLPCQSASGGWREGISEQDAAFPPGDIKSDKNPAFQQLLIPTTGF